ncbi:hypothetical protein CUJ86_06345 [Methanofollis fontis]|uniref:Uncharacterized protein n=2 Tax=Methanofollis fontis TaxID=2052832 RepID=A0A483CXZ2_9EURY|nr:hypothetical protein CUJ86_06345 [Methanofollis fontis]
MACMICLLVVFAAASATVLVIHFGIDPDGVPLLSIFSAYVLTPTGFLLTVVLPGCTLSVIEIKRFAALIVT